MRYLTSISLALIVHVLLSIVVLMALACTATQATSAPTPLPTPDVPLLDEETVVDLTIGFLADSDIEGGMRWCFDRYMKDYSFFKARYVGKDIWIIEVTDKDRSEIGHRVCTITVHDKEAHVILPK